MFKQRFAAITAQLAVTVSTASVQSYTHRAVLRINTQNSFLLVTI